MSKLNERLTLITNLSVVASVIFLATEMRQNTRAIQSQTRDAVTDKQMTYLGWLATSETLGAALTSLQTVGYDSLTIEERSHFHGYALGIFREGENSLYQFESGLFGPEEFEGRRSTWRFVLIEGPNAAGYRRVWATYREGFVPRFRAEIDRIVGEAGGA